jgi:DNA-binding protein HU-beta
VPDWVAARDRSLVKTNEPNQGGRNVNKNDLVAHVAEKADLSRAAAGSAIDAVFEGVTQALSSGDEVRLVGFGTFSVAHRKASEGRNPRTGEPLKIPASKQVKFKPGKGLKDTIND